MAYAYVWLSLTPGDITIAGRRELKSIVVSIESMFAHHAQSPTPTMLFILTQRKKSDIYSRTSGDVFTIICIIIDKEGWFTARSRTGQHRSSRSFNKTTR